MAVLTQEAEAGSGIERRARRGEARIRDGECPARLRLHRLHPRQVADNPSDTVGVNIGAGIAPLKTFEHAREAAGADPEIEQVVKIGQRRRARRRKRPHDRAAMRREVLVVDEVVVDAKRARYVMSLLKRKRVID